MHLHALAAVALDLVSYAAAEGCPTKDAFVTAVEARGATIVRPLDVAVQHGPDGYVGTIVIRDGKESSAPREVRGASCAEVVEGLAVIAAVAAKQAPAEPEPSPPAPAAPPDDDRLRAGGDVGTAAFDVPAGKLRFDRSLGVTAFAGATYGFLPGTWMPRFDLQFTRANFVTTPDRRQFLAGPVVRVRMSYLGDATYRGAEGSVSARGIVGALSACYAPLYDTRGFTLLACAEFGAGAARLQTTDARGVTQEATSSPIGTAGFDVQTMYAFGWFHVALNLGVGALMTTLTVKDTAGREVVHAQTFQPHGELGLGGHF